MSDAAPLWSVTLHHPSRSPRVVRVRYLGAQLEEAIEIRNARGFFVRVYGLVSLGSNLSAAAQYIGLRRMCALSGTKLPPSRLPA